MTHSHTYTIRPLSRNEIERTARALSRPTGPDNTTGTYVGDIALMEADRVLAAELLSVIYGTDDTRAAISRTTDMASLLAEVEDAMLKHGPTAEWIAGPCPDNDERKGEA
jgi:hypothetical protein